MGLALQILGYAAAITLQVLVIHSLVKSGWRRYPFVLVYVVIDLLTNLIEIEPNIAYDSGTAAAKRRWNWIYWIDERVIQAALFLLVLSLIYKASSHMRSRRTLMVALVAGSILFATASTLMHMDANVTTGRWMTRWTRDMNFCAALMDLGLWAMLIHSRKRDYQILMISGALGLQFTAGAIGQAMRDISHSLIDASSVLIVSGNLTCFYIWWQCFRRKAPKKTESRA
jgi:hypothetical protein